MSTLRDALRRFDSQRRCWTQGLERAFLAWLARRGKLPDAKPGVRRILVIRSTNRIGNNLFLLPFLQALRSAHPDADIELVCSGGPLLPFLSHLRLAQLHRVRLQGRHLLTALPILWRLRRQHYDRVYVPFASSTDHLIAAWVRGAEKLGFDDAKGDLLFEHPQRPDSECHYAHQPLQLLGQSASLTDPIPLGARLGPSPELTTLVNTYPDRPLVGFFTGARKGKGLSQPQWQRLLWDLHQHHPTALLIQLTDPADPMPPLGDCQVTLPNLVELVRFTQDLRLFISADTGPLHLAAASGVPCLGLFTQTDPARYGCLGPRHRNQVIGDRNAIPLDLAWLGAALTQAPVPRTWARAIRPAHQPQPLRLLTDANGR
ncbi:glycosyltransferase family 9 protein [Aeromonas veronii]|uniref:glycosyltransferase family 9 protein n=1 Tax=Aeromonas veronii TaxID=654 RepID=UPI0032EDC4B8